MGKHVQLLSMDHLRCPLPLAESWYVLQPRPHCPRWKVYVDDLPQNKKEPRCGHPSCGTRHDPPFFFLHRAASRRLSDPPDKESSLLRAGELFRMLLVLRTNEGERERSYGAFDVVFNTGHGLSNVVVSIQLWQWCCQGITSRKIYM